MADTAKYAPVPISAGNLHSELKPHFFLFKTQRTKVCLHGCVFVFVAFTIFLAFSPSPASSSPWFTNVFPLTSSGSRSNVIGSVSMPTSSSSILSDEAYRSHFSSSFSYFFPNYSQQAQNFTAAPPYNAPTSQSNSSSEMISLSKEPEVTKNKTQANGEVEILKPSNQTTTVNATAASESSSGLRKEPSTGSNQNQSKVSGDKVGILNSNLRTKSLQGIRLWVHFQNLVLGRRIEKKHNNVSSSSMSVTHGSDDFIKSLLNCDFFDGKWVKDESYPLYKPGSCSVVDEQFDCFLNGRRDSDYYKYRWKPNACTIPRLNATHMLEMLRGKRLVFVGDSLNRNMWESLVCILRNSVKDQKKVYEKSGRQQFRIETYYSFVFEEYNCTVEFCVSPFLVQEWEVTDKEGQKKETLRLDLVENSANKYKDADILIFNTGHWWTHEKTFKGEDYYQEGNHVYPELDVLEAFQKALMTWGRWIDAHINPAKQFIAFRGYSASHFLGGQWNSGGACDREVEPIKNGTNLKPYLPMMEVLDRVLKGIKTPVSYLNITRMTDFRKDAHPSMYRTRNMTNEERQTWFIHQDCSHWCLPGVADNWNELLYAQLLVNQYQKQQEQQSSSRRS
ncbi:PREDICTED: protein trichome birefringence-like [Ipomoea nil]|uniref:protein trichome birefringence-like n=1 Tax=Ipomoea nil TaxID=35883 RepID=UPI000900BCFF|nr:PREDICTED: protein trichome birefringence-like [Ipomoea nil]